LTVDLVLEFQTAKLIVWFVAAISGLSRVQPQLSSAQHSTSNVCRSVAWALDFVL